MKTGFVFMILATLNHSERERGFRKKQLPEFTLCMKFNAPAGRLLTDNHSGALDKPNPGFADWLERGHIGLPTAADTVYLDNTVTELPSGATALFYSLKVHRGRKRANNAWCEPEDRLHGGLMTDEAVRPRSLISAEKAVNKC